MPGIKCRCFREKTLAIRGLWFEAKNKVRKLTSNKHGGEKAQGASGAHQPVTGYLASVSKDEGHQGGTWTMRAQAGHRGSRSGKTQQVWKVKDGTGVEDAATRLPLASARSGLSATGDTVAGWGGGSFWLSYLPRRSPGTRGVCPGPCREPAPPPRARSPGTMATSGLSGRTRLPKWASRWPPSGPDPSPRPRARCRARPEAQPRRRPAGRRGSR